MPTYRITVERSFSAAHAIVLYDGTLEPLHGHNWSVAVTVESPRLDEIGLVMDFHALERLVDALLATVHNRNLNEQPPFAGPNGSLEVSPTAERVAWWIGSGVMESLPAQVRLSSVRVGEAPGCVATFLP